MKEMKARQIAKAVGGRVIYGFGDTTITSVSTNSKDIKEGALFVPIIGERKDAHDYIEDAYKNGAVACFTSRDDIFHNGITCIKVEDTLQALQDLATYYREQFTIPIIGITGSVGKTSTKEIVSAVLSEKYNVLKTAGNMNSQVGLPLMMLRLEEEHDIAVIEMGISEEGEMARLVRIAKPHVAIITNIGVSHISQLKSKENIRREKLNIINEFHKDSTLFINGNDPLLWEIVDYYNRNRPTDERQISSKNSKDNKSSHKFAKIEIEDCTSAKLKQAKLVTFGTKKGCDYKGWEVRTVDRQTHFQLLKEEIVLNVLGEHNVNNALCALAVGKLYNIPLSTAKKGLENYLPIAMRGEVIDKDGISIIDDTYNASPDSMKSGIKVLLSLDNATRRIAVLADVLELGEYSKKSHYDIGVFISDKNVDKVITIGKEAKYIAQGINDHNKNIETISFDNNHYATEYLSNIIEKGDALLVKGSRSMRTEEVVKALLERT